MSLEPVLMESGTRACLARLKALYFDQYSEIAQEVFSAHFVHGFLPSDREVVV